MTDKQITSNSEVIMHLVLRLEDGSIAENTYRTAKPVKFKIGDQSFAPSVEKEFLGMKIGDKKTIPAKAEDAFGEMLEENIYEMPRDKFAPELELEEGAIIGFEQQNGAELIGVIRKIEGDNVTVDFNHPLAGHDVEFDIEILDIL